MYISAEVDVQLVLANSVCPMAMVPNPILSLRLHVYKGLGFKLSK